MRGGGDRSNIFGVRAFVFIVLLAGLAGLAGCPRVDFDGLVFDCSAAVDCPPDQGCHPEQKICVPIAQLPASADGGVIDSGTDAGIDGGIEQPDAGEPEEMRCFDSGETWWCHRATQAELELFARTEALDIVDLEMESGESDRRYAAVLRPHEGLEHNTLFRLTPVIGEGPVSYPEITAGFAGMRPLRFAVAQENGELVAAAVRTSRAYGAAGYFYFRGDGPAIQSFLRSRGAAREVGDLDIYRDGSSPLYLLTNYGPADSSTISFGLTGAEVDGFLAQGTHVVRAFCSNDQDRFNVSFNEPEPGEPARFFVHHLSEDELVGATRERNAHVSKLDVSGLGFAAILTANGPVFDPRRAESARLAGLLRTGARSATVGVYSKLLDGPVTHFYNDRYLIAAPTMLAPVIAVRELESGSALTDLVEIPADGCVDGSPIETTETVEEALFAMLGQRDARRARALIDRYGFEAMQEYVTALSMPRSELQAIPGCELPGSESRTTLLDQALMYEYGYHRLVLDGADRLALREAMLGAAGRDDPESLRAVLDDVLRVELIAAGIPAAPAFLRESEILYVTSDASDAGTIRRAITGRLRLPRCAGATVEVDAHFFGLFVEGPGDAAVEIGIQNAINSLFVVQAQRALSFGTGCY